MKAYILRHGEKDNAYCWNDRLGIKDNPLSKIGKSESKDLIAYFMDLDIEKVYVSEYQRTKETIEAFCKVQNIEPTVSELINEIDMGEFNLDKDQSNHQHYFKEWDEHQKSRRDFRYKGGENGKEVLKRIAKFFEIIESEKINTIVVTHEGWIKLALCHILKINPGKRFYFGSVPTCGIMEIEYEEDARKWKIIRINEKAIRLYND